MRYRNRTTFCRTSIFWSSRCALSDRRAHFGTPSESNHRADADDRRVTAGFSARVQHACDDRLQRPVSGGLHRVCEFEIGFVVARVDRHPGEPAAVAVEISHALREPRIDDAHAELVLRTA